MSGETLYNVWATAMENQGVEVDDWTDIGEIDQAAWEETANIVTGGEK
jgi:hypothetical protein